jgi:hypothetical protein
MPTKVKEDHKFRIRQIMMARFKVEFPLHDVADLGMVVQRLWNDIETDTLAVEKKRIIVNG